MSLFIFILSKQGNGSQSVSEFSVEFKNKKGNCTTITKFRFYIR